MNLWTGSGEGPITSALALDRIDPAAGYVRGNVITVSFLANAMRHIANEVELYAFGAWIERVKAAGGIKQWAEQNKLLPETA